MKYYVSFLAVLLVGHSAPAQDRLAAGTGLAKFPPGYERYIRAVLKEGFAPNVRMRAVVYPSFEPEFTVGLRDGRSGPEIFAISASQMVWSYSMIGMLRSREIAVTTSAGKIANKREIDRLRRDLPDKLSDLPVSRCAVPIGRAEASILTGAWRWMLGRTDPKLGTEGGLDGVTYSFWMQTGSQRLSGATWSPEEGSYARNMTRMTEMMRDYCTTRRPAILTDMLRVARQTGPYR